MTGTTTTARPPTDPGKVQQRAGWGETARGWYEQLDVIERQWGALSDGLLELGRVSPGDRVLDLASGIGDPALAAAERVGPAGTVIATDLSPDMLAFAAQRATAAGLTNLEVHEMDAEDIDLPAASVDVVTCRLGLMFLPDLDLALTGVHRVLVPGGRFAAAIPWRAADQPLPRLVGVILGELGLPQPPPAAPGRAGIFSLSDASYLSAALDKAGLTEVRIVPHTLAHKWTSATEWIDMVLAINAPLRQQLAEVPAAKLRDAKRAAADAAAAYAGADGHIRFPGYGYYATATRAAR